MNNRLEANIQAQRNASGKRRSPRKVETPEETLVVVLRLDARTTVRVKPGHALEKWLQQYPAATVVQ